jgi:8-oxo-dGTP diphosphatase
MDTSIGCSVIIYNKEYKVLISQRSAAKKCFPLKLVLVGGGLEMGESPEQCIRREAMEEIGCRLNDLKLFDVNIHYADDRYVGIVFTASISDDIRHNDEIIQTKWVSEDEFDQYHYMPDGKNRRLEKFFLELPPR